MILENYGDVWYRLPIFLGVQTERQIEGIYFRPT